jgi:hypothetical protein
MAMSGTRKALLIIGGVLAVLVVVAVLGIAILVSAFRKGEPTIGDNSLLTLRVAGSLPDYSPDDPFKKYFGGPDQSLTGLVMQFKKAKADKRIKAILLDIDVSGVGWAKRRRFETQSRTSVHQANRFTPISSLVLTRSTTSLARATKSMSHRRVSCSSMGLPPTSCSSEAR